MVIKYFLLPYFVLRFGDNKFLVLRLLSAQVDHLWAWWILRNFAFLQLLFLAGFGSLFAMRSSDITFFNDCWQQRRARHPFLSTTFLPLIRFSNGLNRFQVN
jgi:hypothetical protein